MIIPASAVQSTEQSLGDSLTRGSKYTITITGLPNTPYYIWLPGTFTMTGEPYDRPPVIAGTANIAKDPDDGPYTIGSYRYNNGGGQTIRDDVARSTENMSNTNYYAQVTTDATGVALVEFQTSAYTGLRSYSVKVENPNAPESSNFLVEQTLYRRTARPMINTPVETRATRPSPTPSPEPTTVITTETVPPATGLPAVPTASPTHKSPLAWGTVLVATGLCLAILKRGTTPHE